MDIRELITENMAQAYNLAYRMTANQDEAADIVQECCRKVLTKESFFDRSRPFWPWFARIIRNAIIDRIRQQSKLQSLDERQLAETSDRTGGEQELRAFVDKSLAQLDPDPRMAVILVDLQGQSYEAAAQILNCSVSALGVRLHRARKELKDLLIAKGVNQ